MQLAIIGYGKMGREIETAALEKGHNIVLIVDANNQGDLKSEEFKKADVALEFTTPETAVQNITACFSAGVPVVCGTTGWTGRLKEMEELCDRMGQAMFCASNFSIGVNIMFSINRWLAEVMNKFPEFGVCISEIHHIHKKDSPSGTAITLADDIVRKLQRIKGWKNQSGKQPEILPVLSERKGEVPGTHTVTYKSGTEILNLNHQALNRRVFASGAVMAAEFLYRKKGIYKMEDLLNI